MAPDHCWGLAAAARPRATPGPQDSRRFPARTRINFPCLSRGLWRQPQAIQEGAIRTAVYDLKQSRWSPHDSSNHGARMQAVVCTAVPAPCHSTCSFFFDILRCHPKGIPSGCRLASSGRDEEPGPVIFSVALKGTYKPFLGNSTGICHPLLPSSRARHVRSSFIHY